MEPGEDGPGDHLPAGAVEHDVAVSVLTQLQGVLEKGVISFKLGHIYHLNLNRTKHACQMSEITSNCNSELNI